MTVPCPTLIAVLEVGAVILTSVAFAPPPEQALITRLIAMMMAPNLTRVVRRVIKLSFISILSYLISSSVHTEHTRSRVLTRRDPASRRFVSLRLSFTRYSRSTLWA
jgi:hypothetical protein